MPRSANKSVSETFAAAMDRLNMPHPAAVAVSGGGDSVALMHLLHAYCQKHDLPSPQVVTVDHALRKGSAQEAETVAQWARADGMQTHILTRIGPIPDADIEAEARAARYALIGAWAKVQGIRTICLAHTEDDQAETFLMRLMRGSGVDGLSAMQPLAPFPYADYAGDLMIARPLLDVRRAELRQYLKSAQLNWIEDPMNDDPRFTRVRLRKAAPDLAALGFDTRRLATTAGHLSRVREALEHATVTLRSRITRPAADGILIDGAALTGADAEIALRLISALLMEVGGQIYRPRFERLDRLYQAILQDKLGAGRTLHGCKISRAPRRLSGFGPLTIFIRPENGRKKMTKATNSD